MTALRQHVSIAKTCRPHAKPAPAERLRMRNVLLNRDHFRCVYCDEPLTFSSMTFDHIEPHAHGGRFDEQNLVCACGDCNWARGDMPAEVFLFFMLAALQRIATDRTGRAL